MLRHLDKIKSYTKRYVCSSIVLMYLCAEQAIIFGPSHVQVGRQTVDQTFHLNTCQHPSLNIANIMDAMVNDHFRYIDNLLSQPMPWTDEDFCPQRWCYYDIF